MPTPTTTQVDPVARARKQRIRRKRARQSVVFGSLIAFMVLAALLAVAVYNNAINVPFATGFSSTAVPTDAPITPACLAEGKTKPVGYRKIKVRVFNSSDRKGLAATTAQQLEKLGFQITATGNVDDNVANARISYGAKGIARAYTLAAHISGAVLDYDDRTSVSIDLTVGASFDGLIDEKSVTIKSGTPMEDLPGCAPIDTLTPSKQLHPTVAEAKTEK
ncbi:LytR C-terminal domain-containing protein [Rarobacter incanus]|uniref:LytR cell envelope-related transcriptional attenuator n=1 Tax=Rarobacter incanus TaxID=153494 RepID=A0A542SPC9_9MICO|nr:LytR C-terminal domain-containing protein [Rarobacter incanus]TQK76473.1 LytR cell envelope-related transcriptional attenuator [Rarobacter incanus]